MCKINFGLVVKCIMKKWRVAGLWSAASCGGEMYLIANQGPHLRRMWQEKWNGSIIKLALGMPVRIN